MDPEYWSSQQLEGYHKAYLNEPANHEASLLCRNLADTQEHFSEADNRETSKHGQNREKNKLSAFKSSSHHY